MAVHFFSCGTCNKGLLTISGKRKPAQSDAGDDTRTYAQERFTGAFLRAIELPQNADPDKVQARYVSRKFVYGQAHKADLALEKVLSPAAPDERSAVPFAGYRTWLRQATL